MIRRCLGCGVIFNVSGGDEMKKVRGHKVLDKRRILQILRDNSSELKSYGVTKIGLFGSYARNEQNENSDIDLLVCLAEGMKTFRNFMSLCYFIDELFEGFKTDVVTSDSISKNLKPYIEKEIEYEKIY